MSIDNIRIPNSLYRSLYKKNLVDLQKKPDYNEVSFTQSQIAFLGGNEKHFIFLVKNAECKFLNDSELNFLSSLLSACNITMADIAVINFSNCKELDYRKISSQFKGCKVLCFGVSAGEIDLPFNIPYFQVQSFKESQYIFSPSLEAIKEDTDAKKELWGALQRLFNLKR